MTDREYYGCRNCHKKKHVDCYYTQKSTKLGIYRVCKECVKKKARKKLKNKNNRAKHKERCSSHYNDNKEKLKTYAKAYYEANKDKVNSYQKTYQKQRRKTDPLYKLKRNLRSRTYKAFRRKGYSKNTKTQKMLGVDWEIAKTHIERQFKKGMSWDNYGDWHIDHIIPLASATTEEKLKKLCHYTNLQPLWAEDNLSKSDSVNGQQTMLRV